jgi:ribosome-associated protein
MRKKNITTRIAELLDEKKGEDIKVFDVDSASDLWEYFVVCTAGSMVHARTLHNYLQEEMKKEGHFLAHHDTGRDDRWIVMDFGDVVVHIFDRETRGYYAIEKLWGEKEKKIKL